MNAVLKTVQTLHDPLEAAVGNYVAAKRAEDNATKTRLEAESRLLALCPPKEEGSQTVEVAGFKVTTTGKLSYKCADVAGMVALLAAWPQNLVPVKTTLSLDETGCKYLRQNEPEFWRQLAQHVTVAPAKTSVKVGV